jgi:type I restriction enzyme, S subunit
MELDLNFLPESWTKTQLKNICQVVRGGSPRPMGDPRYFIGEIPFIKISDVTRSKGKTVLKTETKVNIAGAQKSRLLPKGSLILSNSGTVCVPKFLAVDACIHDGFVSFLNLPNEISQNYLYYFFYYIRPYIIEKHRQGITQVNLNTEIVGDFDLRIAPACEQKRIVEKIEELFSDLDNGIDSLKTAQQQLKIYRQAVLKWAFEGKLTAQWREEQKRLGKLESAEVLLAQIKAERERRYQQELEDWKTAIALWEANGKEGKRPGKPSKSKDLAPLDSTDFADLVLLPEGWEWEKLGNLADIVGGVTKGRKLEGRKTISLPYLRVANVQDGYLDLSQIKYMDVLENDLEKYHLKYGDILYTEGGDRDKLGRGTIWKDEIKDCIHQNHIFRARLLTKEISNAFVSYFSRTNLAKDYFYKKAKQTVNLASINMTILSNFPIPVPGSFEQIRLLEEIESRLSICDRLKAETKTTSKS